MSTAQNTNPFVDEQAPEESTPKMNDDQPDWSDDKPDTPLLSAEEKEEENRDTSSSEFVVIADVQ